MVRGRTTAVTVNSAVIPAAVAISVCIESAPRVQVVSAMPSIPVTTDDGETAPSPDVTSNETVMSLAGWPLASTTRAAGETGSGSWTKPCWPSPRAVSIPVGSCSTVADAWPLAPLTRAKMLVVPFPAEVTRPEPISTVATVGCVLAHRTLTPVITLPCWSLTRAVSCSVSPTDAKETSDGVTTIVVGTWGSTGVESPPHA